MPQQAADPAPPVRRIHSLDGLRSGLMLLGVVLHSAYPYSDGARWLVRDPQRNSFFQTLTQGIHQFVYLLSSWSPGTSPPCSCESGSRPTFCSNACAASAYPCYPRCSP